MWSFNIAVADTCQGDKRNILDSKNSARTMKYYFKIHIILIEICGEKINIINHSGKWMY